MSCYAVLQKLATCQQYSQKLALHKVSWHADFPRYHSRYIMQRNDRTSHIIFGDE